MTKFFKIAAVVLALLTIYAIKPHYGGEITVRLNEPEDFSFTPSTYSNLVFYSLIYENFFYLTPEGDILTNIFQEYRYDAQNFTLNLRLKKNLRFSDSSPITVNNIKVSFKLYLEMNLATSRKLRLLIKKIDANTEEQQVSIQLISNEPQIVSLLTAPELVLIGDSDQAFSGSFFPEEWMKGQFIKLTANNYYAGGRSYLDSVKVIFYDYYYPDVFLSEPGVTTEKFHELDAGVYRNYYLCFPAGKAGTNTRVALYSLLKDFYKKQDSKLTELTSLTSNEESPVTLNIRSFSSHQVRSILRASNIKLYILSSLNHLEQSLNEFLAKKRLNIETIYLSDNQSSNFLNSNRVKFLLMGKTFNKRTPLEEKLKIILKELSFTRFDETYLKMLNQLDEIKHLQNEELSLDLASRIIEKIIKDGFILPLFQQRYSIYVKDHLQGIQLDYYGKPIFRKARVQP